MVAISAAHQIKYYVLAVSEWFSHGLDPSRSFGTPLQAALMHQPLRTRFLQRECKHISNSGNRGGNASTSRPKVPGKTEVTGMLEKLSGETRLFPIIGDPIIFVKIPPRLTGDLEARGHNGICVPMQVPETDLEGVMNGLSRIPNIDGLLITMPHKITAFAYCATSSERAKRLGVVSVMRRNPDGSWHGDMLDGLAFVKAQKDEGAQPHGARVLLVGAGGAGSAIAIALLEAGVRELVIHDTDESRTAHLIELLSDLGRGRVTTGPPDPTGSDMVCNATPMGMAAGDPLPVAANLLTPSMFVGDVIAGHGVTPLLQAARAAGCKTANGVQMVEAVREIMLDFMLGN